MQIHLLFQVSRQLVAQNPNSDISLFLSPCVFSAYYTLFSQSCRFLTVINAFLCPRCKKAWDWKKIHTFIFIQLILTANINCTVDNYLPVTLAFPETPRRPDKLSCITRQNPLVSIGFYYSKTLIYRASWGRGIRPGKSRCTVYRGTISIAVHT